MNSNRQKILNLLESYQQLSPKELEAKLGISAAMLFRYLKKLQESSEIVKIGSSPKVFYKLKTGGDNLHKVHTNENVVNSKPIEENFSLITATGEEYLGMFGFQKWCSERKLDISDMIQKYESQILGYKKYFKSGFIDATEKIFTSFVGRVFLDKLYYLDFYSYPVFGRTKISNWLFYGKTLQQKELMQKVVEISAPKIFNFILDQGIDSVLFIPPTVPRKIQFMKVLEDSLNLHLPKVQIIKAKTQIIIQQKSLKNIEDRIRNASASLIVETRNTNFKNLLIIDDFTGSGATLNVVAEKCKKQGVAEKIFGLTITGSINGFEIIKEV